jgi:hypothetical protein
MRPVRGSAVELIEVTESDPSTGIADQSTSGRATWLGRYDIVGTKALSFRHPDALYPNQGHDWRRS